MNTKRIFAFNRLTSKVRLQSSAQNPAFNKVHDKIFLNNPGMLGEKQIVEQNLNLSKGDFAPKSYVAKRVFPSWYKPYLTNYFGNGYFMVGLAALFYLSYLFYQQTLLEQGRRSFINRRDEHWITHGPSLRKSLFRDVIKDSEIPVIKYTSRYIKESGF